MVTDRLFVRLGLLRVLQSMGMGAHILRPRYEDEKLIRSTKRMR